MKIFSYWRLVNKVWEPQEDIEAKNRKVACEIVRKNKYKEGTWKLRLSVEE